MRSRRRRIATAIGLALGGAYLSVGVSTGCLSHLANSAVTSADFGFIFDCDDAVGGTFALATILIDCEEQGP